MGDYRFVKLFYEADFLLENGKVIEFCDQILDLFNKFDCICFLKGQSERMFKKNLQLLDKYDSDNIKYMLVKGVYYYKNNLEEKAYEILTTVIENDSTNDFAYYLRSYIKKEINSFREDDAKNAIILKTSARNYKKLADILYEDRNAIELAKHFYSIAIGLKKDFACAYLNRGLIHLNSCDYNAANEDFKRNIELEKTGDGYSGLMRSLIGLKKYSEAESVLKGGLQYFELSDFRFNYGIFYYFTNKYEQAIEEFRISIISNHTNANKKTIYANKLLSSCEKIVLKTALIDARTAYENFLKCSIKKLGELNWREMDFWKQRSKNKYKLCIENDIYLNEDDKDNFFNSILKFYKYFPFNEYVRKIRDGYKVESNCLRNNKITPKYSPTDFGNYDDFQVFKICDQNYIFEFGKYQGSLLKDIIINDTCYILLLICKNQHFTLNKSILCDKTFIKYDIFEEALELNLIKLLLIENAGLKTLKDQPWHEDYSDDRYEHKQFRKDTFDALSDGQLGDYDDYEGDMDDVSDWSGR